MLDRLTFADISAHRVLLAGFSNLLTALASGLQSLGRRAFPEGLVVRVETSGRIVMVARQVCIRFVKQGR